MKNLKFNLCIFK